MEHTCLSHSAERALWCLSGFVGLEDGYLCCPPSEANPSVSTWLQGAEMVSTGDKGGIPCQRLGIEGLGAAACPLASRITSAPVPPYLQLAHSAPQLFWVS